MKVSILCDSKQATQTISFCFDQASILPEEKIEFTIFEWNKLKHVNARERYKSLFECSYLILSRWYCPGQYTKVFSESRKRNKKVFLHLDDFLFDVPKSIGFEKWKHYSSDTMLESLLKTAELADGIICSTPRLAKTINNILPNLQIFTCPVYKTFVPPDFKISQRCQRPYPVIGYMGTSTHKEDLDLICPVIDELMKTNKMLMFETFGLDMPAMLADKYATRCITLDRVSNYAEFQSVLMSRGWWIGLAPLVENTFNYCKANTKLIEYIQAGIPSLASDFGPYKDTPWTSSHKRSLNGQEWSERIEALLYSSLHRSKIFEQQLMYCRNLNTADSLVRFYRELEWV
jgi:hypothetical protein